MKKTNYSQAKKNERDFQNRKYGRSQLTREKTSIEDFTQHYLTPAHLSGGHPRGMLFGSAIRKLFDQGIAKKRILDYCCGRGDLAVFLAMQGAEVNAFDVSEKAIDIAARKARSSNAKVNWALMDAEHMSYPNDYFDLVVGFEALHHVIIYPKMPSELARIVRRGGKIIFAENWGGSNPIFQFWRRITTLRASHSSERGEIILSDKILRSRLNACFSEISVSPMSLFYMTKKYLKRQDLLRFLLRVDNTLLGFLPFLLQWCGEAVVTLSPRKEP